MTEVADGRHAGTRAMTFGALLDQWLEWRERNGKPMAPRRSTNYRALIEERIKPALGRKKVSIGARDSIEAPTLDVFYERLREGGNAHAERQARARAREAAEATGLDERQFQRPLTCGNTVSEGR